ncbi:polysaccharide biosynthesis/export family protein [Rhizobium herbae]
MKNVYLSVYRILVTLAMLLLSWSHGQAENYKFVAEDKIRLRVVEWRSSDFRYASWDALDGIYTVDDTGNLSIPVAGEIKAGGKTREQLTDTIATALAEKAGLSTKPFVALEVAEHAPIFVTGTVQTPGRYPFEAGMTVMKAVSIAGGFLRSRDNNTFYERDQIQAAGAYRTAILSRRDLIMRQARLRAEIAGQTSFEIPAELAGTPNVEQLKTDELNLMRLRRVQIDSQIAAEDDLVRLYGQEILSLQEQIETQKRQIASAEKELNTTTSLVTKGVLSNSRQFLLDRDLANVQSDLLDLEIALTRSRQSLSESERERTGIINRRNAENQQELNASELAIARASIDIQVAQLLGQQAGYNEQLAQMEAETNNPRSERRTFSILRRNDDGTSSTIEAAKTTVLLPHDLVEIGVGTESQMDSIPAKTSDLGSISPNLALDTTSNSRLDILNSRPGGSSSE